MAIKFTLVEKLGVVGKRKRNDVELRYGSWGGDDKYDLRGWYLHNGVEWCTKGITFSEEEAIELLRIIKTVRETDEHQIFGKTKTITVQLNDYGYDLGIWNGAYRTKGISLTYEELVTLRDLLAKRFGENAEKPDKQKVKAPEKKPSKEEIDGVVKALTEIPVNDGNYPIQSATTEQLREAIRLMEIKPAGNKTRLARCKAKLKSLEKVKSSDVKPQKQKQESEKPVTEVAEKSTAEEKPVEKTVNQEHTRVIIVNFVEAKTKKLAATNEGHSFEECKAKLEAEKSKHEGDVSALWLIDEIIKACQTDAELRDNVMRPDKSYESGFRFIVQKAKEACNSVGSVAMDSYSALKYFLEYFAADLAPEVKPTKKSEDKPKAEKKRKSKTTKRGE